MMHDSDTDDEPAVPIVNAICARVLDDLAWAFFLPLEFFLWLGVLPPRGLVHVVVVLTSPFRRGSLWLRGWRARGVSGS